MLLKVKDPRVDIAVHYVTTELGKKQMRIPPSLMAEFVVWHNRGSSKKDDDLTLLPLVIMVGTYWHRAFDAFCRDMSVFYSGRLVPEEFGEFLRKYFIWNPSNLGGGKTFTRTARLTIGKRHLKAVFFGQAEFMQSINSTPLMFIYNVDDETCIPQVLHSPPPNFLSPFPIYPPPASTLPGSSSP